MDAKTSAEPWGCSERASCAPRNIWGGSIGCADCLAKMGEQLCACGIEFSRNGIIEPSTTKPNLSLAGKSSRYPQALRTSRKGQGLPARSLEWGILASASQTGMRSTGTSSDPPAQHFTNEASRSMKIYNITLIAAEHYLGGQNTMILMESSQADEMHAVFYPSRC